MLGINKYWIVICDNCGYELREFVKGNSDFIRRFKEYYKWEEFDYGRKLYCKECTRKYLNESREI